MTAFESYRVFIEGVCKAYGIEGAIAPLQEGVKVLEEAHKDRTTGGNWFGKTLRDQNNYDKRVRNKNIRDLHVPTAEMSEDLFNEVSNDGDPEWAEQYANYWKRNSPLDNKADKTKTLNVTSKYDVTKPVSAGKGGDQYGLGDDGFKDTGDNTDMSKFARRSIKRAQDREADKDMQSQLHDMTATDAESTSDNVINDLKYYLNDIYRGWNVETTGKDQMCSDADFRRYVETALDSLGIGGNASSGDSICESASGNSKRKLLNKVYAVANPLTGHLYRDDNWAGVYALIDAIRKNVPEFDFEFGCSDGGYSNPGEDGMPRRKTYSIAGKTPEGYPIVGHLHCDAAGTMENPFGAYDMTLVLN